MYQRVQLGVILYTRMDWFEGQTGKSHNGIRLCGC